MYFYAYLFIAVAVILLIMALINRFMNNEKTDYLFEDIIFEEVNIDGIEKHAENISIGKDKESVSNCRKQLITNLDKSFEVITNAHSFFENKTNKREVIIAAEWLLDNYYLIQKEYKDIKYNMPKAYYKTLPVINDGKMKGYPRVYNIALEMVMHTDSNVDGDIINKFISAYQNNKILSSGELWALPLMIKMALIQNLSNICEKMLLIQKQRDKGEKIAERIINAINENKLQEELKKIKELNIDYKSYFTERLFKVLKNNGIENVEVHDFINEALESNDKNLDEMIKEEHKSESLIQISIGNSINSLRRVEALNWRSCFEKLSAVEAVLRRDPRGIYGKMDFESRDYYRHSIEKLSKTLKCSEEYLTEMALELAKKAKDIKSKEYLKHIGYYIIDEGKKDLIDEVKNENSKIKYTIPLIERKPFALYLLLILGGTALSIVAFLSLSYINDYYLKPWKYVLATIVLLVPCSEVIISILNWSITHRLQPRFVPKMDFTKGISKESSTIVVIPTLITDISGIIELVKRLEIYYLSNDDKNLSFAILGDLIDSESKNNQNDRDLINATLDFIEKLNKKYFFNEEKKFYFLCRERKYNEKEGYYLGWERKRGKLLEFNRLLRNQGNTTFNVISSDIAKLKEAKYIITLDTDTELPRDCGKKLVGAMSHILNTPHKSPKTNKIVRGYGLMQPRIGINILSSNKTHFSKIFSGETGIDTYTTAVSDVYQDLFGEGIFTGKGIYDIDTFQDMLDYNIPENTVLSHDLLEGSYVRCALVSDVELIDDYPAYYSSSCKRLHRWVRGDWQLLPWLFKKSPINGLSKFKILDNLRRSLLSISIIALVVLGTLEILPDGTDKWFLAAILAVAAPIVFDVSEVAVTPIKGISLSGKVKSQRILWQQVFLIFAFIPYNAYLMLTAILKTLYRLIITRRNMLEWQTSAHVERSVGRGLFDFIIQMAPGSIIAAIIGVLAFNRSVYTGIFMLPTVAVWFISPVIAYIISKEIYVPKMKVKEEKQVVLRRVARETWGYFRDFVNEKNNWLGPDNYQEDPLKGVAHRTSPTNMGMALTSNVVAKDLGYISFLQLISRVKNTMDSMESLEKFHGHFYNWYDTLNKMPLYPRFVSTVDSGNLVGYLWLMERSIKEYMEDPIIDCNLMKGLKDTLNLAITEIKAIEDENPYKIQLNLEELKDINLAKWVDILNEILRENNEIDLNNEELFWNRTLREDVMGYLDEINELFPWLPLILDNPKINNKLEDMILKIPFHTKVRELAKEIEGLYRHIEKHKNTYKEESCIDLLKAVELSSKRIRELYCTIENLQESIDKMAEETDFSVLYSKSRELFSIGYDMEADKLVDSYYDLLASESRQASFVAIAKGDVEQRHWFKLGRAMTYVSGNKSLVSWSGTMFEYFMPLLIMKSYPETILDETHLNVIGAQKKYCFHRKVPFGISESAYYNFDVDKNYQYKAFGVPGIGLKRGLVDELVVSPYSTMLSLQKDFKGSYDNLLRLIKEGLEGRYGLYEAVDYTKSRIKKTSKKEVIKCFMIHHEGMSLMALDNVLEKNILQERFHSIPRVKATELLLQEKMPQKVVYDKELTLLKEDIEEFKTPIIPRRFKANITSQPETQLLSNGSYSLMISNGGSGWGKKDDLHLYRWREDKTLDNYGMYIYIKDVDENNYFSNTYEPVKKFNDTYEVKFSLEKAIFRKLEDELLVTTEITVSGEEDLEIRRLSLYNKGKKDKNLEIMSYCEVVLDGYDGDLVHPAFGNLFITTEYVEEPQCILATRRPRAKGKTQNWMMQKLSVKGDESTELEYETSRVNFIGRNRTLQNPVAMEKSLDNTEGVVLDPIISLKKKVTVKPGETIKMSFITAISESRDKVLEIATKYDESHNINRVFQSAYNEALSELKYLGIKFQQANLYQSMASRIIFLNNQMRERKDYIKNISKGQNALWSYGISGDLPIVLLIVREEKHIEDLKQILLAHEYWSSKGLRVDLVVINLEGSNYYEPVQGNIMDAIYMSALREKQNKPGGVFVYNKASMNEEDVELLKALAKLVLDPDKGSVLTQGIEEKSEGEDFEFREKIISKVTCKGEENNIEIPELKYFNGYGGYDLKNNEYVINLYNNLSTPAPWINIISNGDFGFHVSESGASYTWAKNSREFKITTWNNDWVSDTPSEVFYIRDNDNSEVFTITKSPINNGGQYVVKHGFGYSIFEHKQNDIYGKMTMFSSMNKNIKFCKINLKNTCDKEKNLTLSYYAHMVLGVVPQHDAAHIYSDVSGKKKYIYSRNPYSMHFNKYYSYLKLIGIEGESFTGDRSEFIGRGKSLSNPSALSKEKLSNTLGAGIDPCLATMGNIKLKPNEEKELVVLFGVGEELKEIDKEISEYSSIEKVDNEFKESKDYFKKLLTHIEIKTPDESMNLLVNGWLMYQTLVCRIWARTGFYQSGGAYGFRDQLQDSMSLTYLNPTLTRNQILYSASRQFIEGDVQHWWHPGVDSGIRTRFSDDLLWLPFVTIDYIKNTGDYSILDEEVSYLEDDPLREGEDERYNIARVSKQKGTIYEHCIKSIERGLNFGEHNIPLMGSGDWNDGMSTVGNKGRGESVWLGWFIYSILNDFKEVCEYKKDKKRKNYYSEMQEFIRENLEKNAWDGKWYRRAYFDDGTPLGSHLNEECKIDSLSQSWSIISGAGDKERREIAMDSLEKYLVKKDKGLIMLLTPPFYKSDLEPGYIKGYVPGVRENGGQYTHAATWVILALTKLGRGEEAVELFDLINPINHSKTKEQCDIYKTEPYVMSADVYAEEPYVGRGGWSWYTGTSGWMYRVAIEGILGLKLKEGKGFTIAPCIPKEWDGYEIKYTKDKTIYNIKVKVTGHKEIRVNGEVLKDSFIRFSNEKEVRIDVTI
ncbi:Cellobiose phosphorylase [Clostridium collagenovorans DSM 3089]|uniref:Cellobiose phosphorylase n=1 Tax=Clostridium collagenovorans DSM 3089 TaxID=1121306 RepID=A0A1M5XWA2_9CLOT|nr:glucoamylase family protein [Clostridium collagenovorans]SHI04026.1 Cellobiose phosphorylase [Clostridium collagenovorans DSM 3089]